MPKKGGNKKGRRGGEISDDEDFPLAPSNPNPKEKEGGAGRPRPWERMPALLRRATYILRPNARNPGALGGAH